ncbi:MAG: cytochrome d ubiquinol oxidase subunit II [Anaerolineales bacterium]|nr:cytochrome d ubiquinol oxidase subunit II [Anaerolineales bacterium]MDO9348236.1 cytochrome d ubiquinol oxidase subunit II [Anaerolineales bacterium]
MDLNILWFILITVLYLVFFFLEGFDFGVGMLLPLLGKNDTERRVIINTIGPHWDGNEVWLLTAGGATFAAFPHWYATMFSGFYPALFLLLLALIVRGVSFEFRSKDANPKWRSLWDWAAFAGSLLSALLLGVAFANLAKGVPIDANMTYTGTLWTLLNPYGLIGGLATVAGFALYGAIFLSLKTTDKLMERARAAARKLWLPAVIIHAVLLVAAFFYTDILTHAGIYLSILPVASFVALLLVGYFVHRKRNGWAFGLMGTHIALVLVSCFAIMFPRVMISTLDPAFSLTIYNASSSPYTLKVMSIVALVFVPIVLAYQAWSYWIFRKRIEAKPKELTY